MKRGGGDEGGRIDRGREIEKGGGGGGCRLEAIKLRSSGHSGAPRRPMGVGEERKKELNRTRTDEQELLAGVLILGAVAIQK